MTMVLTPGLRLRQALKLAADQQQILPLMGIYDLFSASLAADRFEALFLSGFGLAASAYGLPDIGFIGWGLLTTTSRLRATSPILSVGGQAKQNIPAVFNVHELNYPGFQENARKASFQKMHEPLCEDLHTLRNILLPDREGSSKTIFKIANFDSMLWPEQ